jgi:hypothetical protein
MDPPNHLQASNLQYINEYDSYGYMPPAAALNHHLQQSTILREGYHINPSNIAHLPGERVKSESRLVASQVRSEDVVKGTGGASQGRAG